MPVADLTGIQLKLDRAKEHLKTLKDVIDGFDEDHPEASRFHIRRHGKWHIIESQPLPETPPMCAVIAGDFIYNLRSALDQLVWQLILREGKEPQRRSQFPIYDSEDQWLDEVRYRLPERNRPLCGLTVGGDAWALIEEAQPYRSSNVMTNLFAIIRRLSNLDKHRMLYTALIFPDLEHLEDVVGWNPDARLLEQRRTASHLATDQPTEIWRLRFEQPPDPGVYVKGRLTVFPTIGEGDHDGAVQMGMVGGLEMLLVRVEAFVAAIRQLPNVAN